MCKGKRGDSGAEGEPFWLGNQVQEGSVGSEQLRTRLIQSREETVSKTFCMLTSEIK